MLEMKPMTRMMRLGWQLKIDWKKLGRDCWKPAKQRKVARSKQLTVVMRWMTARKRLIAI